MLRKLGFQGIKVEPAQKAQATSLTCLSPIAREGLVQWWKRHSHHSVCLSCLWRWEWCQYEVSGGTNAADGAEVEGRECCHSNIGTTKEFPSVKEIHCAEPSNGLTSTVCGARTPEGSAAHPGSEAEDAITLVKSWTNGELGMERQRRSATF